MKKLKLISVILAGLLMLWVGSSVYTDWSEERAAQSAAAQRHAELVAAKPLTVNPDSLVGKWYGRGGADKGLEIILTVTADSRSPGAGATFPAVSAAFGTIDIVGLGQDCNYFNVPMSGSVRGVNIGLSGYLGHVGEGRSKGSFTDWEDTDRFSLSGQLESTGMSGVMSTEHLETGFRGQAPRRGCPAELSFPFKLSLVEAPAAATASALPSDSSNTQTTVAGAWDIASVMKLVYGAYDPVSATAFWSNPDPPAEKHFDFHSEQGGTVQLVLDAPFVDGTTQKRFVVTATSPAGEDFSCHACSPLLGAFVFAHSKTGWAIESEERFLLQAGGWGKAPTTELVRLADGHYGIRLTANYSFQGEASTSTFIAEPISNKIVTSEQQQPQEEQEAATSQTGNEASDQRQAVPSQSAREESTRYGVGPVTQAASTEDGFTTDLYVRTPNDCTDCSCGQTYLVIPNTPIKLPAVVLYSNGFKGGWIIGLRLMKGWSSANSRQRHECMDIARPNLSFRCSLDDPSCAKFADLRHPGFDPLNWVIQHSGSKRCENWTLTTTFPGLRYLKPVPREPVTLTIPALLNGDGDAEPCAGGVDSGRR